MPQLPVYKERTSVRKPLSLTWYPLEKPNVPSICVGKQHVDVCVGVVVKTSKPRSTLNMLTILCIARLMNRPGISFPGSIFRNAGKCLMISHMVLVPGE